MMFNVTKNITELSLINQFQLSSSKIIELINIINDFIL